VADYSLAIELKPENARAFNNRAMAYLAMGKPDKALKDAEKAVKLLPNLAAVLDTRALVLERLGRKDRAIADYRRALEIDPGMASAKNGLKRLGVAPKGK
jgi:tetratricopeptide (TPR) repeat protein